MFPVENLNFLDFLGAFFIILPTLVFILIIGIRGIDWALETFKGDLKENIFHHHFHYKAGQPRKK